MERITINTALERFVMVHRLTDIDAEHVAGEVLLAADADPTLLMESLAQLGGLHIRHTLDFERHAFLVKVADVSFPYRLPVAGTYFLHGTLLNRSSDAFSYALEARQEDVILKGNFLFGVVDYNDNFQKDILQNHFRKVFACLKKS